MTEKKRWVRVKEAARLTGIPYATLQTALWEKRLKGRIKQIRGTEYKIILIDPDSLAEFAAKHKPHPKKRRQQ